MKKHTEIYKYQWDVARIPSLEDLANCPNKLHAFRINDLKDKLLVTAISTDNDEFNTLTRTTLEAFLHIVQDCLYNEEPIPEPMCRKPMNDTVAYLQADADVLIKLYEPLLQSLTKRASNMFNRFFSYDDLLQQAYLTVLSLSRHGYYVSKNLIQRTYFNDLFMMLRKLPTKYVVISLEEPTNEHGSDDTIVRIIDTIKDERDAYDELHNDIDLILKRTKVISMIGRRQYDQMLREFTNNTTTNATSVRINKLRKRINKNGKF